MLHEIRFTANLLSRLSKKKKKKKKKELNKPWSLRSRLLIIQLSYKRMSHINMSYIKGFITTELRAASNFADLFLYNLNCLGKLALGVVVVIWLASFCHSMTPEIDPRRFGCTACLAAPFGRFCPAVLSQSYQIWSLNMILGCDVVQQWEDLACIYRTALIAT